MYYYKVRFTQVPHTLAMQAGEKESVVAIANDVPGEDSNVAIANAAADNADAIKAVRKSKSCLHVSVKQD